MRQMLARLLYLALGAMLASAYVTRHSQDTLDRLNNGCVNLVVGSFYNGCVEGKSEAAHKVPARCDNMSRSWYQSIKPLLPAHSERAGYNFNCRSEK